MATPGCASAPRYGALEEASQAVADGLREGGDDALTQILGRYDEVRIYVHHTAIEPPLDVVGDLLVGAGAVAFWARRIRAQTVCADPDSCPWAALEAPSEAAAWRCAGACCEVGVTVTDHRRL